MMPTDKLLGAVKRNNLIKSDKLQQLVKEAEEENIKVAEMLKSVVDPEEIAKIEADYYGLPYENLMEGKVPEEALNTISSEVAQNYKIICFGRNDKVIKVGITDPDNFKAMEAVDFLAKENDLGVEYYYISDESFKAAFRKYKSLSKELSTALESRKEEKEKGEQQKEESAMNLEEVTKSAPVAKIVSVIIRHAIDGNASDIHVEPLKKESRVRYRIDGILYTSLVLPRNVHSAIVARIKVMANMKLDEARKPQDGRFVLAFNERDIDFRVSTLPLSGAEKVVMRVLDTRKGAPKIEDLGYQGVQLKIIKNNIQKTEGMMLVTGPTGSGKSTTIFSILDSINSEEVNIATLEDPVEYQLKGINQSQIKPEIGYTFASGLRSFLRQDPDIIMVGEIRDQETAELSVHAALTGHTVLSTLHTTSAVGTIARLADMKIEPFLIGSTLHTTIAQRLVRRICSHCKEEVELSDKYRKDIAKEMAGLDGDYIKNLIKDYSEQNIKAYKGKGCARCGNSGYKGRLAIVEVLDINKPLASKIKEGRKFLSEDEVRETQTFVSSRQDGMLKVLQGLTSYEEVLRVMKD